MLLEKSLLVEVQIFAKAQLSAFTGGLIDFISMIVLTEIVGVFYVLSIMISGTIGAFANFGINKYWTFEKSKMQIGPQLIKFVLMVLGSIGLKCLGTYLLTETLMWDYKLSRLMTDVFVCFGFNYILQRFWIFR